MFSTVSRHWKLLSLPLLSTAIFVADTVTALEIAVAVFYVLVILLSAGIFQRRGVIRVILACILLTLVSYGLSPNGNTETGLINLLISLTAIASSGWLALQSELAQRRMLAAQEQVAHRTRITALGELSASIAHEINQPLGAAMTSAQTCIRWLNASPPVLTKAQDSANRVVQETARASDIIQRVRALASPHPGEYRDHDIHRLIDDTVALAKPELNRQGIALKKDYHAQSPVLHIDAVQIQQVLLNLIVNAIESLTETKRSGKEVHLSTKTRGQMLVLSVSDNGPGLDEESEALLFEAFYTTKKQGMGIGLAVTRSIVEKHGGSVEAARNRDAGACISICLPLNTPGPKNP